MALSALQKAIGNVSSFFDKERFASPIRMARPTTAATSRFAPVRALQNQFQRAELARQSLRRHVPFQRAGRILKGYGEGFSKAVAPFGTAVGNIAVAPFELSRLRTEGETARKLQARNPEAAQRLYGNIAQQQMDTAQKLKRAPGQLVGGYAGTALTALGGGAGAKAILGSHLIGGGLSAGLAGIQGEDPYSALGQGMGGSFKFTGLNRLTSPFIDPIVEYVGRGKPLVAKLVGRAFTHGGLNVVEDIGFNALVEQRKTPFEEAALSFVIGALTSPLIKYDPKNSFFEIVDDKLKPNRTYIRDVKGRFAKQLGTTPTKLKSTIDDVVEWANKPVKVQNKLTGETYEIKRYKSILQDESGIFDPREFLPGQKAEAPKVKAADQPKLPGVETPEMPKLPTLRPELSQDKLLAKMGTTTKQQAELTSQQRTEQVRRAVDVMKGKTGEELVSAGKQALTGKFQQVTVANAKQMLDSGKVQPMFKQITDSNLSDMEKFTASRTLLEFVRDGRAPRPAEMKLLRNVFGAEVVDIVKSEGMGKLTKNAIEALNLPRAIMATADLSAPLRQGIFLIGRPKQWIPAFTNMFKYAFSEDSYRQGMDEIKASADYEDMVNSKLALTEMDQDLSVREEAFMSQFAEKIPIFGPIARGSNRAYAGFLNKLRADVFSDLKAKAAGTGNLNAKTLKDISWFVNNATGRGDLPGNMNRAAPMLNNIFFSPRLIASRFNLVNPVNYVRPDINPMVRKEMLKSLVSFGGTALTVLGLAKLAGADVEDDPRNADFGKIRVGNTRYDILGGFQQYIRLAAQLYTGQIVSSQTGNIITVGEGYKPLTRAEILSRFFRNKTSPVASFVIGLMSGENTIGQKFDVAPEIVNRFIPMVVSDIYDLAKEEGFNLKDINTYTKLGPAAVKGSPAIFGTGAQTYGTQELKTGTDPFGRPTTQIKPVGGLAEDVVDIFRGEQPLGTTKTFNAQTYYQQLKEMPPQEANQIYQQIKQTNPDLAKKLKKVAEEEQEGITPEDRRIRLMGVANGERAMYIYDQTKKLKTNEEKNKYISELKSKGVITDDVWDQLKLLVAKER